jgi:type IV pilus assembly protein PilW
MLTLHRQRGFTLVEMMVAMVLGLIVVGAVVALVVAVIHSNRTTLQSTRLHQELRATLQVVANDLRRARSVADPLSTALLVSGNPFAPMRTDTDGCIVFAYDGAINGPWHVIKLDAGRVVLQGSANEPGTCSPPGTPTPIGSDQIEITDLDFSPVTTSSTPPLATDEAVVREFTVTITGRLRDDDPSLQSLTRTMSQTIFVRSVGAGI